MTNETMIDVILDNEALETEEFVDLFKELFDNQGNKKYYNDIELSKSYAEAVECLFDTELTVEERITDAINICKYCFEAFYFFKMLSDENELYNFADLVLYSTKDTDEYKQMSEYETISISMVLDDISSLYMFRESFKKAVATLNAERGIDENTFLINKIKLFICLERIEDYDSFKKYYEDGSVDDLVSYLLYLCVLIKNLKTDEIAEVLMDMFHDFEESYQVIKSSFLEEEYVADEEIELAFEFAKSSIESIPNFYDILVDIIRKNNISPIILEN